MGDPFERKLLNRVLCKVQNRYDKDFDLTDDEYIGLRDSIFKQDDTGLHWKGTVERQDIIDACEYLWSLRGKNEKTILQLVKFIKLIDFGFIEKMTFWEYYVEWPWDKNSEVPIDKIRIQGRYEGMWMAMELYLNYRYEKIK